MNKKIFFPASIVAIIIIIGGVLFLKSKKEQISVINIQPIEHSQWKTYLNSEYGFEFQYPEFLNATSTYSENTVIGKSLADFESDRGTIDVAVRNKKFDQNNIEGIYVKIPANEIKKVSGSNIDAFIYIEGDAGCGAKRIDFPLGDKTIIISVGGCEEQYSQISPYAEKIAATIKITK